MFQTAARVLVTIALAAPAWAQPPVQNGRVDVRKPADLAGEIATLAGGATEAAWAGWRVPIVGVRSLCNWYVDDSVSVRGFVASTGQPGEPAGPPRIAPPTGPVPIEAGTGLVVLVRLKDREVERLRTLTDDCPIDAGGRTIHWFEGVAPSRSLEYLEGLTRLPDSAQSARREQSARRGLAQSAISAIALHADPAADVVLDRLAGSHADASLRRHAAARMGAERGAQAFDALQRLLARETDPSVRRGLVAPLAQTGPRAAPALLALARGDAEPGLRSEAAYHYIRLAGAPGVDNLLAIIERDADAAVRKRAVHGLASLPEAVGVPHLIALARTSKDALVRKEAVSRLGRTTDPRAIAYLTEILSSGQTRK
jgi:hypothetical protein